MLGLLINISIAIMDLKSVKEQRKKTLESHCQGESSKSYKIKLKIIGNL